MESTRASASRLLHLVGLGLLLVGAAGLGAACDGGTIGGSSGGESDETDITEDGDADGTSGDGPSSGSGGDGAVSSSGGTGAGDTTSVGTSSGSTGSGGDGGGSTTSTGTGDATSSTSTGSGPACGDGACDPDETCETCASDCGACDACAGASDATTGLDAEEQAFLVLINDYRAENGRAPLTVCTSLSRAAQGHSEDMRDQDYFSHTSLDGSSPSDRACDACFEQACGANVVAENIAAGNSGAAGTFEQWRSSAGHNANMLGNYTQIGIGRATGGGTYGTYWTNKFTSGSEPSCN